MKRIYLDYNATTPVDPAVLEEAIKILRDFPGNPSSVYEEGRRSRVLIEDSRDFIKSFLRAGPGDELIFTSGGSESINLAIVGAVHANARLKNNKKPHIITSTVEHPAVLNTFKFLEYEGAETSYIGVDGSGKLDIGGLVSAIKDNTILVSVMGANNETGTIFPLKQILNAVKARKEDIIFHSDLVQLIGKSPFSLREVPLDLCGFSGHKFYALKGCGGLYIKKGIKIDPIINGGHQERGLRAGTENIAGIASMAKALEIFKNVMKEEMERIEELGNAFIGGLSGIKDIKFNGNSEERLKNTVNLSIGGVKAETLLFNLDLAGIAASAGSACNAGTISLSRVLSAHGYDRNRIESSIRFSLGRFTTMNDIKYSVSEIKKSVEKLRANTR